MQTSESIKEIAKALVCFHKEVGKIAKDSTNPFFKSKYVSLSNILDGISEPLNNNGLSIIQFPEGEIGLTTRLLHITGEWMEATYLMQSTKNTPQDKGSAMTYQRRYAIGAILSLNIDEDDDGNKASQNGKATSYVNKKPAPKPIISANAFKEACKRIDNGEFDLIEKVQESFTLDATQLTIIESKKQAV